MDAARLPQVGSRFRVAPGRVGGLQPGILLLRSFVQLPALRLGRL
jgi:hypothetical protein